MKVFRQGFVFDSVARQFRKADIMCDEQGVIREVGSFLIPAGAETEDFSGRYLLPGLVDVHTHGRSGYDFNSAPETAYQEILRGYALSGTTSVMATLASDTFPHMLASAGHIRRHLGGSPGLASMIGLHFEGRYLSPVRRGAHAEALLKAPKTEELDVLREAFPEAPLHISLAPELKGAPDFISYAVSRGTTVGIAHSDADYDCALEAIRRGATSFTHTFNAMSPLQHREPGCAGASLLCNDAYSEFICDGLHLHPAMLTLAFRCKPADRLVLITDSMEATGMPDGEYAIAGQPVFVRNGRAMTADNHLAGSTLTLFRAVVNMMQFCGLPLETVLPFATLNPARMVGADAECGSLTPGRRCDFLVIGDPKKPVLEQVYTGGTPVR